MQPTNEAIRFLDRRDAGNMLAERLAAYRGARPLVLGIPRGGMPVAAEVASALKADLDVIVAHKVGAPGNPEFAMGAVTANGGSFLDEHILQLIGMPVAYMKVAVEEEMAKAKKREALYRGQWPQISPRGRTTLVVDDGLATGATMRAAVRSVRKQEAAKVVVAVPVGSGEACKVLSKEADEVVCYSTPTHFRAVGLHYINFEQVEDAEVMRILADFRQMARAA
jgi:predicted phosphoribosyltransferase